VYLGQKQTTGTSVEKAGLTNGNVYGIKVAGLATETNATTLAPGTRFDLVDLGVRTNSTAPQLETDSNAAGVTRFLRPEDGSWDPSNPRRFYFVTTNAFNAPSRLWRLTFDDPANPAAGGTIEQALDGTEGQQMLDNITVAENGDVLALEDVGNNTRLGKVWRYDAAADTLTESPATMRRGSSRAHPTTSRRTRRTPGSSRCRSSARRPTSSTRRRTSGTAPPCSGSSQTRSTRNAKGHAGGAATTAPRPLR
jgi:hypothetical protein